MEVLGGSNFIVRGRSQMPSSEGRPEVSTFEGICDSLHSFSLGRSSPITDRYKDLYDATVNGPGTGQSVSYRVSEDEIAPAVLAKMVDSFPRRPLSSDDMATVETMVARMVECVAFRAAGEALPGIMEELESHQRWLWEEEATCSCTSSALQGVPSRVPSRLPRPSHSRRHSGTEAGSGAGQGQEAPAGSGEEEVLGRSGSQSQSGSRKATGAGEERGAKERGSGTGGQAKSGKPKRQSALRFGTSKAPSGRATEGPGPRRKLHRSASLPVAKVSKSPSSGSLSGVGSSAAQPSASGRAAPPLPPALPPLPSTDLPDSIQKKLQEITKRQADTIKWEMKHAPREKRSSMSILKT